MAPAPVCGARFVSSRVVERFVSSAVGVFWVVSKDYAENWTKPAGISVSSWK